MARTTYLKDIPPEMIERLVQFVSLGAFPYVAAKAACGIPSSTWFRWMASAEKDAGSPYRELWERVTRAHAQARVLAEAEVRKDNPLAWLRMGPGRDRPGEPGWTDTHEITPGGEGSFTINISRRPEQAQS